MRCHTVPIIELDIALGGGSGGGCECTSTGCNLRKLGSGRGCRLLFLGNRFWQLGGRELDFGFRGGSGGWEVVGGEGVEEGVGGRWFGAY